MMAKAIRMGFACLLVFVLPGIAAADGFVLVRIASGLDHPVYVTQAPNDPGSIYVLERYEGKPGQTVSQRDTPYLARVKRVDLTTLAITTWLELEGIITIGDGGMHCMAFHPDFATNGKFYINGEIANPTGTVDYAGRHIQAASFLDEYIVTNDVPTFNRRVLVMPQIAYNNGWHAMNWIGFEPGATGAEKSYLYITEGDGGIQSGQTGFENRAEDLSLMYGKMLRIDVDGPDYYPADQWRNYAIPPSNPFFEDANNDQIDDDPNTAPEIFHYGLRNPWRASFDRATGDIYIGDVGRNNREEVSFAKAGSGPIDFGWARREGTQPAYACGSDCDKLGALDPIYDYGGGGKAVMGGYVYRGPVIELQGLYFFADHIQNILWTAGFDRDTDPATYNGANLTNVQNRWSEMEGKIIGGGQMYNIVSFGEDLAGNLYFTNLGVGGQRQGDPAFDTGQVFRIVPTSPYCNVRSLSDMSGDCLVTLLDLALIEPTVEALRVLAEDWLVCGLSPVTACP